MTEKRTPRDFVRDLCRAGRTDVQVRAVAWSTRWKEHLDEVISWLKRRGDRWRRLEPIEKRGSNTVDFSSTADIVLVPSIGKVKLKRRS